MVLASKHGELKWMGRLGGNSIKLKIFGSQQGMRMLGDKGGQGAGVHKKTLVDRFSLRSCLGRKLFLKKREQMFPFF